MADVSQTTQEHLEKNHKRRGRELRLLYRMTENRFQVFGMQRTGS